MERNRDRRKWLTDVELAASTALVVVLLVVFTDAVSPLATILGGALAALIAIVIAHAFRR
jgi:hypothetical protein